MGTEIRTWQIDKGSLVPIDSKLKDTGRTEQERVKKKKKFEIPMSDEPGSYEDTELYEKLKIYLSRSSKTNQRIREVLFPACLNQPIVTRDDLKKRYLEYDPNADEAKVGYYLTPYFITVRYEKE